MKKSRIIIPALAVMALSMGAAVTSTVAWFTANRNATATGSPVSIINPEGNLSVTAEAGFGTNTPSVAKTAVTVEHNAKFRDGSVDLATGKVYTSNLNDAGTDLNSTQKYRELSGGKDGTTYGAESYTLHFTFGNASTKQNLYGLFLDASKCSVVGTTTPKSCKGLRVGFQNKTSADYSKVFGPLKADSSLYAAMSPCKTYVNTVNSTASYSDNQIIDHNLALPAYETEKTQKNLLGDFDVKGSPLTVDIVVWTWFEGTDTTNVVDDPSLASDLTINLNFNIVEFSGTRA